MNQQQITAEIYTRYLEGVRHITNDEIWLDETAIRLVLWLALTEQAERLNAEPTPDVNASLKNDLATALDTIRGLQDEWATEAAANASLKIALAATQNEAGMLRQQRADLQERLDIEDALNELDQTVQP